MHNVAFTLVQKRVAAVRKIVERWQIDHEESQFACDVEDIVTETASLLDPIQRITGQFEKGPQPESGADQFVSAHTVAFLLNEALRLFPKVNFLMGEVRHLGFVVEGLDRFEQSRSELVRIDIEFRKKWLLPDEQIVKAAKRDMVAGKCRIL